MSPHMRVVRPGLLSAAAPAEWNVGDSISIGDDDWRPMGPAQNQLFTVQAVPAPHTAGIADAFAPAYIRILFIETVRPVAARVNVPDTLVEDQVNLGRILRTDGLFWAAGLQSGFQGESNHDEDPKEEESTLGMSHKRTNGSIIFEEPIRDVLNGSGLLTAERYVEVRLHVGIHELGHQFGLGHPADDPVMSENLDFSQPVPLRFSSSSLHTFRENLRPIGSEKE